MTKTLAQTAEEMFHRAMDQGYAFGFLPHDHPQLPGWKRYLFVAVDDEGNEWRVVDEFTDNGGRTIMTRNWHLVWVMRYVGHYEKRAIPVLKSALAHQYKQREFLSGRGPRVWKRAEMTYENRATGNFSKFEAHETIRPGTGVLDRSSESLDFHDVWGGMLC
jgi:hypothetical protein